MQLTVFKLSKCFIYSISVSQFHFFINKVRKKITTLISSSSGFFSSNYTAPLPLPMYIKKCHHLQGRDLCKPWLKDQDQSWSKHWFILSPTLQSTRDWNLSLEHRNTNWAQCNGSASLRICTAFGWGRLNFLNSGWWGVMWSFGWTELTTQGCFSCGRVGLTQRQGLFCFSPVRSIGMHKGLGGDTAGKNSNPYRIMLRNKTGQRWRLVDTDAALGSNQFVVRNCLFLHHLYFLAVRGREREGSLSSLLFFYFLYFIVGAVRVGWC